MEKQTKLSNEHLKAFGDALHEALDPQEDGSDNCGGDHAHTRQILGDVGLSYLEIESTIEEFCDLGGYCDCKVMLNVVCRLEELTPDE
jgi:hypothetical protein